MTLGLMLRRIAMPQAAAVPVKHAVFEYSGPLDIDGECADRELTEFVFDTFDEAADKAEDLDAANTRSGRWYGVDTVEEWDE